MEPTFERAWRRDDPVLGAAAIGLWEHIGVLKADGAKEANLKNLCLVGKIGEATAGVSTITLRHIQTLNCRMAMLRVAVAPEYRMDHLATKLAIETFFFMETWARENPTEDVRGMGTVVQSAGLVAHERNVVWPDTKLIFVGYTAQGEQFRVRWFDGALVPDPPKPEDRAAIRLKARQM